jgi:hypothetical protein
MPRKSKHQKLTCRIDEYINKLLNECDAASKKLSVEQKVAVVNALGKWVAIKNKLIDAMEGEKLDDFRARLRQGDALKRETGAPYVQRVDYEQKSRAGRKGMASRWGLPDPESTDGPASCSPSSKNERLAQMTAVMAEIRPLPHR